MRERMKKLAVIFGLVAACGLAGGCANQSKESAPAETSQAPKYTEVDSSMPVVPGEPESSVEASANEQPKEVSHESLSGDWTNMDFMLDGKIYQVPFSYKEIEEEGWTFDLADYDYENGYILNPGSRDFSGIRLNNPAYPGVDIIVTFENRGNQAVDIKECDVYTFELDIRWADADYPQMTIGNGLTFGDSMSKLEEACGPCDSIYGFEDYDFGSYQYEADGGKHLNITVFDDERGIVGFVLKDF